MVVERGVPFRTVADQLAKVWTEAKSTADIRRALEHAYDVEAVTRRFFEQYRFVFDKVLPLVGGLEGGDLKLFCQTVFNRLMFLYFLQRKGWLTFKGDGDYLAALWKDWKGNKQPGEQSFYESRLRILFFAALNNPQNRDFDRARAVVAPIVGTVPFLNGGLFEESELDKRTGVSVPDEAIDAILRDLFDRFNFTIAESTPYDIQVAVDPEMLGKVFEELVTGRHDTGSYYTPRPIVSFMCREALKTFLVTRISGLDEDSVAEFVDEHRVGVLTMPQARQVLHALEEITVVDPACGSGAYLLGMLQELIELEDLLYSSSLIHDAKTLYEQKLHIIERNLYGADIDRFAINTAMLRLWLSLMIDYDGPGDPPPLPNLDFKIVCGDSLLAPNPNPSFELDMFRRLARQHLDDLVLLRGQYMRAIGGRKHDLHEQIKKQEAVLSDALAYAAAPLGSIDWRVRFAEVFASKGGFDIVLANPPYVRQELIKSLKPVLQRTYPNVYTGTADLYCYFYARGLQGRDWQ